MRKRAGPDTAKLKKWHLCSGGRQRKGPDPCEKKGSGDPADLRVLCKTAQNNSPDREHGTNRLGRTQSSQGASNSAYDETDWHDLGNERFAGNLSDMLYKHAHASSCDELTPIAAPDVLGNLRKALRCGTPRTDPCQFARNCDGLGLEM